MKQASGLASGPPMTVSPHSHGAAANALHAVVGWLAGLKHFILIPIIFVLWELGVRLHWIDGNILPAPSATIGALIDLAQAGYLWRDIEASVLRVTIGFGLAAVAAVSLGLALGIWRSAAAYILPVIGLLRPI